MGNYENLKQSITEVIRTNGNQEITGAVLQSTLLTIISTVGANATFAGIATPSTNPGTPDGPVFYLASESGTYTNFNAIELQDGLSVLMWNGSWRSQQIFGVDNVPTAGSNNLVKSGGVFNNIGAIDVSELNATENPHTLAKYEDLTSALTALPTSYRKGGMSVKFVQSSDNKYVQYRLMTTYFSPTESDWQGVDDAPIQDSNNLVKSGGVEKYITQASDFNTPSNGKYIFAYTTEKDKSYLIYNNTDGFVTIANTDDSEMPYFMMAENLPPHKTAVFTYPQSSATSIPKVKIVLSNANAGGNVEILQTMSAFTSLMLDGSLKNRVENISSDILFKSGSINASGENIGQPYSNPLRCYYMFDSANIGKYIYFSIKTGYTITILEWDGISAGMDTYNYTGSWYHLISKSKVYVLVGKTNFTNISEIEAYNNVSISYSNSLSPFVNITRNEIDSIYLNDTQWRTGSIVTSGEHIGEGTPNPARINKELKDVEGDYFTLITKDGYHVVVYGWDGVSSAMHNYGVFRGKNTLVSSHQYIYILGGKDDFSAISVQNGLSNIQILKTKDLSEFLQPFRNIGNDGKWVQGSVIQSGEHIGEIDSTNNIRCVKELIDIPLGTALSYVAKEGYKVTFLEWDGVSDSFNKVTSFSSLNREYGIYVTSYTKVYALVGRTNDSNVGPTDVQDNIRICGTTEFNTESNVVGEVIKDINQYNVPYSGERLPFNNKLVIKEYITIANWPNSQAGAMYGDFLITALAMDEIQAGNTNGHLYNIRTGQHISNLVFGNTLGGKTYTMPHGNQICFGTEFYNAQSVFPLLYVSQTTLYNDEINKGELGVLVYDIQKVSDSEYTPVLVQAIIPDLEDTDFRNKISKWTTNYVVDTDNNKLYLVGYPRMWDWSDIYNSVKGYYPISRFELPKLSDGDEVVLSASDLEENYEVYRETAVQMLLYYKGRMLIQGGFDGYGKPKYLDSVNLAGRVITTQINLSNVRNLEPQFIGVYNDRLLWYDAGASGKIDEFIFPQ